MPRSVLYYIRHGETDWNVEDRLQGRRDTPLNANGRMQAVRCGEILRDLISRNGHSASKLDYVSSPLARACVTMQLARQTLNLAPDGYSVEKKLSEISFGSWEGRTWAELAAQHPRAVADRGRDRWNFLPPEGESYEHVMRRVGEWYGTVSSDTVVTSHGGVARSLFVYIGAMTEQAAMSVPIEQGVVYVFADGQLTRYTRPPVDAAVHLTR